MDATTLTSPARLWSAREVLVRPCPVPSAAGVYGWHFKVAPYPELAPGRLLYAPPSGSGSAWSA